MQAELLSLLIFLSSVQGLVALRPCVWRWSLCRRQRHGRGAARGKRSFGTTTSRWVAAFVLGAFCLMKAGGLVMVARCLSPPVSSPPLAQTVHAAVLDVRCTVCLETWPRQDIANGMALVVCVTVVLAICAESSIGLAHCWLRPRPCLCLWLAASDPELCVRPCSCFRQGDAHIDT